MIGGALKLVGDAADLKLDMRAPADKRLLIKLASPGKGICVRGNPARPGNPRGGNLIIPTIRKVREL